jgi:hypothetical protein
MKSSAGTAVPIGVLILIRPEPVAAGTGAITVVVVTVVGTVDVALKSV